MTLLVGAIFVIPVGMLVDRAKRVPMLSVSIVLWSVASLAERVRRQLLDAAADAAAAGRRHRHRGPRDRVADRRLLPLARARAHLRLHPRRRDRGHGGRLHGQRHGRERDLVAGRVRAARDPRASSSRARCGGRVPEPLRGGQSRLAARRRRSRCGGRRQPRPAAGRGRRGERRPPPRSSPTRRCAARRRARPAARAARRTRSRWASATPSATCSRSRPTGC